MIFPALSFLGHRSFPALACFPSITCVRGGEVQMTFLHSDLLLPFRHPKGTPPSAAPVFRGTPKRPKPKSKIESVGDQPRERWQICSRAHVGTRTAALHASTRKSWPTSARVPDAGRHTDLRACTVCRSRTKQHGTRSSSALDLLT